MDGSTPCSPAPRRSSRATRRPGSGSQHLPPTTPASPAGTSPFDVDPQAAAAQASLREQIVQRWEIDPEGPRDATTNTTPQLDRLAEAMDPQWRESATTQELEQRWSEAQSNKDHPGAAEALAVLDTELHERFGLDVEKLRRSEHDMTETLWHTAGDHAAAEAGERASIPGWENEAHADRNQEATAGDDVSQEVENSVDAREAKGKEIAGSAAAEAEHEQARADAAAMERAGVPSRSQQVRLSTARGFGASTKEGAKQPGRLKERKVHQQRSADHAHDRGR